MKNSPKPFFDARSCPICDSTAATILYQQNFGTDAPSLIKSYDVSVCLKCGGGYADHIPSQSEFDEYYREMSKYEYAHQAGQNSLSEVQRFEQTADAIEALCPSRAARVLDIGCATGQMLATLKKRGYADLQGSDPSPRCAQLARELHGIDVTTQPLEEMSSEKQYDLILMLAVVEHLNDARRSLEIVLPMLDQNGLLYIEVPDAARFVDFDNAPFQQFSVEHINFFTQNSLNNFMAALGLELVWSQNVVREINRKTLDPGITAAYRHAETAPSIERDATTLPALQAYISKSNQVESEIAARLETCVQSQQPLIIWGVGTNILHLLQTTNLKQANIVAFVDSNPKYQGKTIHGHCVVAPSNVQKLQGDILIGSRAFQDEIEETIRENLKLTHPVIKLYSF